MTTPDQVIANIREALEAGPTPGEWCAGDMWVFVSPASGVPTDALENILRDRPAEEINANVSFIAAVNPQNIAVLLAAFDSKDAETRCIVADVAKDFRAVNVNAVMAQMGDVVPMLLARAEAAEAERDALLKALEPLFARADKWKHNSDNARISVTLGELRRARTLSGDKS